MSWRKQNVLSLIAIAVLIALNTLPVGDPDPRAARTTVAQR
jgi:hypothetical protein